MPSVSRCTRATKEEHGMLGAEMAEAGAGARQNGGGDGRVNAFLMELLVASLKPVPGKHDCSKTGPPWTAMSLALEPV
jgi:hypothetical protein